MADLKNDSKKEEEEYGGFEPDDDGGESFMLEKDSDYPAKLPDKFGEDKAPIVPETPEPEPIEDGAEQESTPESEEETNEQTEDSAIEEDVPVEEDEPKQSEEDEIVELDEDFKKKLIDDIEKSKSKRETKIDEQVGESAKQIGDDAETVVSLNDIEADKPSNSGLGVVQESNDYTPPEITAIPLPTEPPTVEEEAKEKKKRPVWLLMLFTATATFLLTVGLMLLLWGTWNSGNEPKISKKVTQKNEDLAKAKANFEKKENMQSSQSQESKQEQQWLDSMKDANNKDSNLALKETKDKFSKLEDKVQEKPKVERHKEKKTAKKITPKKTDDLANNEVNNKKAEKTKKSSPKIDESQFSMPQPKGPAPEKGIFTVQIYSSPSKEDAESWLGQLKARQVPDATITEQEIKGRTWYRVRFGKFETKEDARSSALKLGYSKSWIDRIK